MLVVCTGNICRSALAERLGRAYLDDALGENAGAVRLESAGVRAVVDAAMHPDSALVVQGLGGDPAGFRARQFRGHMAGGADLTMTMTRWHRQEVLRGAPRALSRTFTLLEAADLVTLVGEDAELPGDSLPERARSLVRAMAAARGRRVSGEQDDVRDPIGLPAEVHEQVGDVIAAALIPVLARITALRTSDARRADADAPG